VSETRKLAAILAADVVGFSRLASADEDRTLARLRALRSDLIDPTIAVHHGRVVKRTGDGALVEFRSVVDAVRRAIEIQNAMVERNAGVPAERRIEFRIGIHLGDVVEEADGDLMGDGVNIAARLEGIAKPGAICLSEDAFRQVRARLDLAVSDLGETQLKNIAEPVRVYALTVGLPAEVKPAAPVALPDKLSIAVLPFQNMSGDPEQEYFADGISEDIITALSKLSQLFVIARNSSFTFFAHGYNSLGVILHYVGRSEEALPCFERAMALDPFCPGMVLHFHGQAYFQLRRYEEAAAVLKRRILRFPETDASRVLLAACYGEMGRLDEAREQWREALRVNPDFSLDYRRKVLPYKNPADFEAVVDGLRKAGVVK